MTNLIESYSHPVMTSFFRPLTAICCSVALASLSGCGGSSTEAEGFAPAEIKNCRLNVTIDGGVVGNLGIAMPPQFELDFDNQGRFEIIDRDSVFPMWHSQGISTYHKQGDGNSASLTLIFNSEGGDAEAGVETTQLQISMPNLVFRDETHGSCNPSTLNAIDAATKEIEGTGTANILVNILSRNTNSSTN